VVAEVAVENQLYKTVVLDISFYIETKN